MMDANEWCRQHKPGPNHVEHVVITDDELMALRDGVEMAALHRIPIYAINPWTLLALIDCIKTGTARKPGWTICADYPMHRRDMDK